MGVDFVADNVTGGGARTMSRVANAAPDGSIFYAASPSFVFTSLLSRPANPYADMDPIVNRLLRQGSRLYPRRKPVRHTERHDLLDAVWCGPVRRPELGLAGAPDA